MNIPKVLIIDDMADIRLHIKLTLKRSGEYHFLEASNGKEGYETAIEHLPHIILMDAIMPVMDGFEAIKKLRDNEITKGIPILMISSLGSEDEKVKALKSGISDFISKPFDKNELIIRVNSLLHLYMKFYQKEQELKKINLELETKVNEMLENRILDIKLASIGQMAAGITHELNTPVTYMKSNLEFMKYDIEDIEGNEDIKRSMFETLEILNNGILRLKGIINNTREISKKGDNRKKVQNVYSTIIYASRMVYNRFKHLTNIYINDKLFQLDLDENFETFEKEIIKEKMEQVWIIILNNACDEFERSKLEFDDRKVDIKIYYDNEDLVLKFKDNAGNGIDQEMLPNIFEPFKSTKTASGMGVGLNIAREIIHEHNGDIKAYNEDNCAVFEIRIKE